MVFQVSQVRLKEGYSQSNFDHSLFVKSSADLFIAVLVYVDDIITARNDAHAISGFKDSFKRSFKLKYLGDLHFFLGLEIARSDKGIIVTQRQYTLQLLLDFGYLGCKPSTIPMDVNLKLSLEDGVDLADPTIYRRLIGKLIYLTIPRSHITYSVNKINQFLSKPKLPHL